ncbi:cupin domain-containing protein [Indioceanicola profundi]|uniref:cupin domain-containing protein n=1 Tax=Indioceanicola profundi TaxID=2220096 RepID=UPI000E6A9A5A|nr:cupin domain-containing protein [Indioceanicola profundi]
MPPVVSFKDSLPSPDSYRPDAEKIVTGDPVQTVANGFSSTDGRFNCGVWTGQVGSWRVSFTENEFCHLLEGKVIVTDTAGDARTFTAGDAFVMPAGFVGTWEVVEPAKKLYAVYE